VSVLQLFRDLSVAEEQALRASIERFGVLVPVVYDADGRLVDGHHRRRIAEDLGVPVARIDLNVSGDTAVDAARDLNVARRHLDRDQRRAYVVQRRADGASLRTIANEVGASKDSVARDLTASGVSSETPEVIGADGKTYPAKRPARTIEPGDQLTDDHGDTRTVTQVEEYDETLLIVHDDDGDAAIVHPDTEVEVTPARRPVSKPNLDGNGLSHPARYSDALMPVFAAALKGETRVLDPFAGTGRIHELRDHLPNLETVGVELEPEWANLHPDTIVGDALALPFDDETFSAICTSPTYGNRLADRHDARDDSIRRSYTHDLGRPLTDNNSGALQWGDEYRDFHQAAWTEAARVLEPGGRFVLNIKNHIRGGVEQPVAEWHLNTLLGLGFNLDRIHVVGTPSLRQGENATARVEHEFVFLLTKESAR
jgi:SAM-dependent methyltransferase